MFHNLNSMLGQATVERLTLLVNHLLSAEPVANERLRGHAGRCMQLHFSDWPAMLPPLPDLCFRVTPAGLLEWCGTDSFVAPDLRIAIDVSNPVSVIAQAFTGTRPRVEVSGDAAFAADLDWLFDNLRWDMQDDLSRIVGETPAREISRLASAVARGLREAVRGLGAFARGRDAPDPSQK